MTTLDTKAIRERAERNRVRCVAHIGPSRDDWSPLIGASRPDGLMGEDAADLVAATINTDVPKLCDALDAARAEVQALRDGPCCPTCSDQEHNPESKLNLLRAELAQAKQESEMRLEALRRIAGWHGGQTCPECSSVEISRAALDGTKETA